MDVSAGASRDSGGEGSHHDDVARTAQLLAGRRSRRADFKAESQALAEFARTMAEDPSLILRKLAELVLELCGAQSAGISVLDVSETGEEIFTWPAVAGAWDSYVGGTMPRGASPCGIVIDCDRCLIFEDPVARFPAAGLPRPLIGELLLAPFHVRGKPVGTVWAILHDPQKTFDGEDMRLMTNIAAFASLRIFAPPALSFAVEQTPKDVRTALDSLTSRQQQILDRILQGQPNKNIAADLGISKRTIENHRAKIMKKMGVGSVSALVQVVLSG